MTYSSKAVANYFIDRAKDSGDPSLSPMKLQKLVYFAHGWSLGLKNIPLIDETIEAWPYGPVIPVLYHEFKHFGNTQVTHYATDLNWGKGDGVRMLDFDQIVPEIPNDDSLDTQTTRALLNRVWEVYRPFTPIQLSNLTHEPGTPWDEVNRQHKGAIPKGTVIDNELIGSYFANLASQPDSR